MEYLEDNLEEWLGEELEASCSKRERGLAGMGWVQGGEGEGAAN